MNIVRNSRLGRGAGKSTYVLDSVADTDASPRAVDVSVGSKYYYERVEPLEQVEMITELPKAKWSIVISTSYAGVGLDTCVEARGRSWCAMYVSISKCRHGIRAHALIGHWSMQLHSNLTQWKRAGLITLKSLDRNQELLIYFAGVLC